ncbi:MAG: class I SAM-dependent methyltransferase [Cyanobacteriota/Melainabacteria group bacterium]
MVKCPSKEIDTDIEFTVDAISNHIAKQPLSSSSLDFVHLSNTLDWLSEDAASNLLQQAGRVLRPGGTVIIRQLNSSIDIRALPNDIAWDGVLSRAMLDKRPQLFFYRNLHIGFKPCKSGSRS